MLEWNAFIKPLVYTIEIIFAIVVTAGTADKLLFYDPQQDTTRCILADNLAACASVISLGSLCTFGGIYVLWKRLSSAFLCDMKYRHDTESIMCFLLSVGWLSVSSVVTAFRTPPQDIQPDVLRAERTVTITFAWLLWVFHIGSIAIAWFAPDEDVLEGDSTPSFPVDHTLGYHLNIPHPEHPQPYPMPNPVHDSEDDHEDDILPVMDMPHESTPAYEFGNLASFLEQHDDLEDALPVSLRRDTPSSISGPASAGVERMDELRPKATIQDLASVWKNIVTADIDAEKPEVDITQNLQQGSGREGVESGRISASVSGSVRGSGQQRSALRKRTVRFLGDEEAGGRPSTGGSSG